MIYDYIDRLFRDGEFEYCDSLLKSVIVENLDSDLIMGYLTATLPAKGKLPSRKDFLKRAKMEIKKRGEDSEDLWWGLE